jgi:hypothetical protein
MNGSAEAAPALIVIPAKAGIYLASERDRSRLSPG